MKSLIKKFIPAFLTLFYHKWLAKSAAFLFGYPSDKLMVIGVTGTNGKSTVVNLCAKILEEAGYKVGLTSTYNFKIGGHEWLNDKKMTMLGRFQLQSFLSRLVKAGGQYAVVETSSEGIKQFRHLGINYDAVIFTNLTPEHLESHGSFAKYQAAKGELFKHLTQRKRKNIAGKRINKISIVNLDDEKADYFLSFAADEKYSFALHKESSDPTVKLVKAEKFSVTREGTQFVFKGLPFNLKLLGEFNISNALAALTLAITQDVPLEKNGGRRGLDPSPKKIFCGLPFISFHDGRVWGRAAATMRRSA